MTRYEEYLKRKHETYGEIWDPSALSRQFIPYFNSGQRIVVQLHYGEIERGYVDATSGWKPAFLLLHRKSDRGSSTLLSNKDEIIGTVNKFLGR